MSRSISGLRDIFNLRSLRRRKVLEKAFNDSPEFSELEYDGNSSILSGLIKTTNPNRYALDEVLTKLLEQDGATTNVVDVNSIDDLPTPSGGVITLNDSTIYNVHGAIDLGSNRLVMGIDTTIRGNSPKLDYFTSTTTGALITSTKSFRAFEIGFQANSGTIFDLNGTGVEICLMFGVRFFGTGALGNVSDYDLFEITTGLFVGYSAGLTFGGNNVTCLLIDVTFYDTTGVTSLDLGTATFNSVKISDCDFTIPDGGVGIDIAPNGDNINASGGGIITGCTFNLSGSGVATVGYDSLEDEWLVAPANINIIPSDRILPTGWAVYVDGETSPATQTITTTYSKLQIDALGGTTNETRLPSSIRGSASLWDNINNKITPITVGDSYNLRLDIEVTAKTGGVSSLFIQLDIGGGASPTIVIVDRFASVAKTPPFPVSVGFPIYCLETFLANGGQIFLACDTGTLTIASRSIVIQRVSSGAI